MLNLSDYLFVRGDATGETYVRLLPFLNIAAFACVIVGGITAAISHWATSSRQADRKWTVTRLDRSGINGESASDERSQP